MEFEGGDGVRYTPSPVGRVKVEYFIIRCEVTKSIKSASPAFVVCGCISTFMLPYVTIVSGRRPGRQRCVFRCVLNINLLRLHSIRLQGVAPFGISVIPIGWRRQLVPYICGTPCLGLRCCPRSPQPCWHSSACLLYTSPSPRDGLLSRMPSSA